MDDFEFDITRRMHIPEHKVGDAVVNLHTNDVYVVTDVSADHLKIKLNNSRQWVDAENYTPIVEAIFFLRKRLWHLELRANRETVKHIMEITTDEQKKELFTKLSIEREQSK